MPHILVEKGDMTLGEFEQHLREKTGVNRELKKDGSVERKVRHWWQSRVALGTDLTEPQRVLSLKWRA